MMNAIEAKAIMQKARATNSDPIWQLMGVLYKSHPWHGIQIGPEAPQVVTAYIEMVPTDTVKYEIDKATGHLRVDRPQRFASHCPTLYGLIPQTYCAGGAAGARTSWATATPWTFACSPRNKSCMGIFCCTPFPSAACV